MQAALVQEVRNQSNLLMVSTGITDGKVDNCQGQKTLMLLKLGVLRLLNLN
jgi:hypothetical protein